MTSFQISISPKRRASARFISRVRRALISTFSEEHQATGVKQADVARALEVNRSVITRQLNGRQDLSVGTIGELAWALGREVHIEFRKPGVRPGSNRPVTTAPSASTMLKSISRPSGTTRLGTIEAPMIEAAVA